MSHTTSLSARIFLPPVLLAALLLSACETSKRGFPESSNPSSQTDTDETGAAGKSSRADRRNEKEANELRIVDSPNRLVATVVESKVQYKVPREVLMQRFTLQFDDGTVVDKTTVRQIKGKAKNSKPTYYLVGLGQRNGMFRAMALPLELSTDNELYLSVNAERYLLEGRGCVTCYFSFEENLITGAACEDNSGGGTCDLRVVEHNTFFPPKR